MNAVRKSGLFVMLGLAAVLVIGLTASLAEASGGHHKSHHGHHVHKGHHGHHFHKGHTFHKVHHGHYKHYTPTLYQPIVKYVVKPYTYPVTQYDCYGQPYVVWQTGYQTVPTTYFP